MAACAIGAALSVCGDSRQHQAQEGGGQIISRAIEDPLAPLPPEDRDFLQRVRDCRLSYLSDSKAAGLMSACRQIAAAGIPGGFIEAGCALGGSAAMIAHLKPSDRPLALYDVFGMIPAPTAEDPPAVHERWRVIRSGTSPGIGGDTYYGYQKDLDEVVRRNLRDLGLACENNAITLVKGLLQDTLWITGPVAFAHVDVDWYEPVKTCLVRIFPHLSIGGAIILDDYRNWGGCKKAADEYLAPHLGKCALDDSAGSLRITRTAL